MGTFTDSRDGEVYKTVNIGTQTWMAENFRGNFGTNLDVGLDPLNRPTLGKWYSPTTAIAQAPTGWHLPTPAEFNTLISFAGGEGSGSLKNAEFDNGTDSLGFNIRKSGMYYPSGILLMDLGILCSTLDSGPFYYALQVDGPTISVQSSYLIDVLNNVYLACVRYIKDVYDPGNASPTDITLSNNTINEHSSINTTVGTLTSTDADVGNTFTYTLVTGAGDTNNIAFNISGDLLRSSVSFNYPTKSSYSIRIRTTDNDGLYFEKQFTVNVLVVDSPTLTSASITVGTSWNRLITVLGNALDTNDISFNNNKITEYISRTSTSASFILPILRSGNYIIRLFNESVYIDVNSLNALNNISDVSISTPISYISMFININTNASPNLTTSNGSSWATLNSPADSVLTSVASYNDIFAFTNTNPYIQINKITNINYPTTWTIEDLPITMDYAYVCSDSTRFILIGRTNSDEHNYIYVSQDASNWTQLANRYEYAIIYKDVQFIDGFYYIWGFSSNNGLKGLYRISDLSDPLIDVNYTSSSLPLGEIISYGNGKYVIAGNYNEYYSVSYTGANGTWSTYNDAGGMGNPRYSVFAFGEHIIGTSTGNILKLNSDNTVTKISNVPYGTSISSLTFNGTILMAGVDNNIIVSSLDAINWNLVGSQPTDKVISVSVKQ